MHAHPPATVALISLGCPKNLVDSERILAQLSEAGFVGPAPVHDADVIVINTCGFLASAREEALEVIDEALHYKASGRADRVVVAGCLVNRDAEDLWRRCPGIDALLSVDDREGIVQAVAGEGRVTLISGCRGEVGDDRGRFRLTVPHSAYVRIAEGCSRGCTFCTIPAIRGPFRSKPRQQVLDECRELLADGAVELNLIAQDTTCWGRDLDPPGHLAELIAEVDALAGLHWGRLMYAYPNRFDDRLIEALGSAEHFAPYVDMPLQHIADPVLRAMGRGCDRKQTVERLDRMREGIPGLALRTTFIVGFPGETEAHFRELLAFVQDQQFQAVGVFAFSPEEGTPAAEMGSVVPHARAVERAEQLMETQLDIVRSANARAVGSTVEVLVDGQDEDGAVIARHAGQAPEIDGVCLLDCDSAPAAGSLIDAEVVDFDDYELIIRPQQPPHPQSR